MRLAVRLSMLWVLSFGGRWVGAAEPIPIRPLAEVAAGQRGTGRTVVAGQRIDTFDFEVVDVLHAEGFASSLILVKVTGELIEKTGGIAAGMSGSPLFVDGALIGAIAFTTPFSDLHYGYATPIEDMLKVFDHQRTPPLPKLALAALPAGTPILVGGLRGRAFEVVAGLLGRRGLRAVQQPAGPAPADPAPEPAPLAPGSAIAASLSTGDVVLTALGTLTWRQGERVLAFGHPFLQRGDTSLFLHPAFIYGVIPSVEIPFKVGAPAGPPLGAIVQDRAAGLGGVVGWAARSLALTVDAGDDWLARRRKITVQLVQDDELTPTLAAVCLLQAASEVMDRAGGGTARLDWTLAGEGLPRPLHRTDLVYSPVDVVGEAASGPLFCLDALLRNDFSPVTPTAIDLKIDVSPGRQTARLVSLTCRPTSVRPGQSVEVAVRLQPYRAAAYERRLTLQVPPETPPGPLVIELHGRPEALGGPLSAASLMARGLPHPGSLEELLTTLASAQRGNTLTAELLTPEAALTRQQLLDRLRTLPTVDLFRDEPGALPSLAGDLAGGDGRPLTSVETLLEQVVQGRLRAPLTVLAP